MPSLLAQATALHNQGQLAEAERMYRSILAENPDQADALALLGVLIGGQRDYPEALRCLKSAIELDPATPLFRFYLGNVLADSGAHAEAVTAFQEATARHRDFGAAWLALSDAAVKIRDFKLAEEAAAKALRLMPDNLMAHVGRGLALYYLDREDEAVLCFKAALNLKPDCVPAWDILGTTYQSLNRLDDAEAAMRKALDVVGGAEHEENEENYLTQHWHLGLLELLRGDYRNGFDHYRARFSPKGGWQRRLPFPQLLWRGEDLRGKKILIAGEQGLGDVLMMCRYGALLKARGARVTLLAHPELRSLFALSDLIDNFISDPLQTQDDFDFQASLFDLPLLLGTTLDNIPARVPYLPLPPADTATRLPDNGTPRIGVVWAGRSGHGNDWRRSIPLNLFVDLFRETGVRFFNLTREIQPGDKETLSTHSIIDLSGKLTDFLATARLVNQLDLVIACDTSVAHLAGGMGKKTWLLLPFAPDWRWLMQREDSPWYPSMRLFRQRRKGDWSDVITRVQKELKRLGALRFSN